MDAHERARLRGVPLVARLMRIVSADRGCQPEDLSPTLQADIENAVLDELRDIIDPWAADRRTQPEDDGGGFDDEPTRQARPRKMSGTVRRR